MLALAGSEKAGYSDALFVHCVNFLSDVVLDRNQLAVDGLQA